MNMLWFAGALVVATAGTASGAGLVDLIAETRDGRVRFSFEAREGVWGDGDNRMITDSLPGHGWCRACQPGPVRVELELEHGRVVDLEGWVGGTWRGSANADLGEVDPAEAAAYLLSQARETRPAVGEEAVALAPLARGAVVWRELRDIALDASVHRNVREAAVFWISQYSGTADQAGALDALDRVYRDVHDEDVRKQVIFAYSQCGEDRALERLLEIAGTDPDSELRGTAVFWLGQSDDPRAIAWIEHVILD